MADVALRECWREHQRGCSMSLLQTAVDAKYCDAACEAEKYSG